MRSPDGRASHLWVGLVVAPAAVPPIGVCPASRAVCFDFCSTFLPPSLAETRGHCPGLLGLQTILSISVLKNMAPAQQMVIFSLWPTQVSVLPGEVPTDLEIHSFIPILLTCKVIACQQYLGHQVSLVQIPISISNIPHLSPAPTITLLGCFGLCFY